MKSFLIKTCLFSFIFIFLNQCLGSYIANKRNLIGYYPTIRWNEFYSTPQNSIDLIFLGSSHCYRSIVPNIGDTTLNINSFNMGSSGQFPIVSYYILKEILNHQSPHMVVLEVYHSTLSSDNRFEIAGHNFDHFKNINNKYNLIKECSSFKDLPDLIFPTYRFNNLKSLIFQNKQTSNGVDKNTHSYYSHKGYVETPYYKTQENTYHPSQISSKNFKTNQIIGLKNIIDVCKINNIELIIFTQPYNPKYFNSLKGYKIFSDFMNNIAIKNDIKYIDFNIQPHIEKFSPDDFYDHGHMFKHGAEKFTKMLINEIKKS